MPHLDQNLIAESKEVMKENFPILVQYFIEDTIMYIKNIEDAIAGQAALQIVLPAHTIKSSAKTVGAVAVCEVAIKIETLAKKISDKKITDFSEMNLLFAELKKTYEAAEPELKNLMLPT